jgi:hypothetical protein
MSLVLGLLQGAAQLAGVGGLILSVKNYQARKGDAARAEERDNRRDLREMLFELQTDLKSVLSELTFGNDIPSEPPPSVTRAVVKLPQFAQILDTPTNAELGRLKMNVQSLKMNVQSIDTYWLILRSVISRGKDAQFGDDPDGRKRIAQEGILKETITETLSEIERTIKAITRAK